MGFEERIIDAYLEGRLRMPAFLKQALLNGYLSLHDWLEGQRGRRTAVPPQETEEIAARSRELMETHYNMPLAMFSSFLGPSMKYSMALWENGARSLDEAQEAMLADLCAKAEIRDGQRILDIGCGFGSFVEHALHNYPNAKVYGLTLSQTQADYMRARQGEPGHVMNSDRFFLIQEDFNNVHFDQPFDRIVSIGVFEHVSNLSRALEKVRSLLTSDGVCLLHYIVYQPRPGDPGAPKQDPFIDRYVFPGGRIWARSELGQHPTHLRIDGEWFLNGNNYRRTLQAWLANYVSNWDTIRQNSGLSERQLRLWEVYLRSCIGVFGIAGGRRYGNAQYRLRPA